MKTSFPVLDKRDGAIFAHLYYKTLGGIFQLSWNSYLCRGSQTVRKATEKDLKALVLKAKRAKEKIIAGSISNYGVEIIVAAK